MKKKEEVLWIQEIRGDTKNQIYDNSGKVLRRGAQPECCAPEQCGQTLSIIQPRILATVLKNTILIDIHQLGVSRIFRSSWAWVST